MATEPLGKLLFSDGALQVTRVPKVDARKAASDALCAYLAGLEFVRWGGDGEDVTFQIPAERINSAWPDPQTLQQYPSVTVLDLDDVAEDDFNFVPEALVETFDEDRCTVLWKTAEVVTTFQVDFWADHEPLREAIAARLPAAFAPTDGRYGIVVSTGEEFFGVPVTLTLISMQRADEAGAVYANERRLMVRIRAELADVHERRAVPASVQLRTLVEDPSG